LFALRELTGQEAGEDSAEWRRLLRRIGLDGMEKSDRMRDEQGAAVRLDGSE